MRSSLARGSAAWALAASLFGALVLIGAAPRAEAQSVHYRCGSFSAGDGSVYVSAEGIACKLALELQEAYWLAPEDEKELVGPDEYNGYVRLRKFPGWHCTSGALAGGCHKGQLDAGYFDGAPEGTSTPCGSLRINYSPLPGEHYSRMYLRAPLSRSRAGRPKACSGDISTTIQAARTAAAPSPFPTAGPVAPRPRAHGPRSWPAKRASRPSKPT